MRRNEKGLAIVEIIVILVIIGLVATVAWLFFDRQQDKVVSENNNQQASSNNETKSDSDSDLDSSEGYLVLKEWGIRFKVPNLLQDTDIIYTIYDDASMGITTARVKAVLDSCQDADLSGGTQKVSILVDRSTDGDSFEGRTDGPVELKDDQVNGFYYSRSGWLPVTSCLASQVDLQRDDADALDGMLKSIESIAD